VRHLIKTFFYSLTFILIFSLASPSDLFAQSGLRIYDDIGGGGSNTIPSNDNDNTFIYVAGGLLIAGIIAYALFVKKDDKTTEADTTASIDSRLIYSETNNSNPDDKIMKAKDKIPVDLFLGVMNKEGYINDKTYLVGLKLNF
jgi:hypothetical protein